jgi:hypothetical protein
MTEAEALEVMTQRWLDAWRDDLQPDVPFTFDGEVFDSAAVWARVTFVHTVRRQATMGSDGARKFESRGSIFVQLFGPVGVGVKQLAELADDVRTVFEGRRLAEELTTYAGSSRESTGGGRWMQKTVIIPFVYEELR